MCYASHYFAFLERSGVTLRPEGQRRTADSPRTCRIGF
jgi:hypothetical protein